MIRLSLSQNEFDRLPVVGLAEEYRLQENGTWAFAPEFDDPDYQLADIGQLQGQIKKAKRDRDRVRERLEAYVQDDGSLFPMDVHHDAVAEHARLEEQVAILRQTVDDEPRRRSELLAYHERQLREQLEELETDCARWRNQVGRDLEQSLTSELMHRIKPLENWGQHLQSVVARQVGHDVVEGQVVAVVRDRDGNQLEPDTLVQRIRTEFADLCAGDRRGGVGRSVASVGNRPVVPGRGGEPLTISAHDARTDFAKYEALNAQAKSAGTQLVILG